MLTQRPSRRGFTLIELMIVVAILGILAAIAIPAFSFVVKRSKAGEASTNLNMLFKGAASYYLAERAGQGSDSDVSGFCTVGSTGPLPAVPRAAKQKFDGNDVFKTIGFTVADYVYYSYAIESPGGACGLDPGDPTVYTFHAQGDLDGDGNFSTFELAVGSDATNTLYHARGIYIVAEAE